MSAIFDALEKIEVKEGADSWLWSSDETGSGGLSALDLPEEILSDFYDLREYVRLAGQRAPMQVLSVTSSLPREGSSTVATYLALLMAKGFDGRKAAVAAAQASDVVRESADKDLLDDEGGKGGPEMIFQPEFTNFMQKDEAEALIQTITQGGILLVDANLHHPGIHRFFGLEADAGLAEVLEKKQEWRQVVRNLRLGDLHVITAGSTSGNPAEIIGSGELAALIQEWREEFRYVLIDTPAVLNHVEALALSAMVDGVILVVRSGHTRWEMAQNAKRKLSMAHANLLGVALNRQKNNIPDGFYNRLI